jgi:hypothetical protein
LSVILNVAEREPLALGLKLTLIAQLAFAARELPQVFPVTRKSDEFDPVMVTPEIVKAPTPGLLSVTVFAVLVVLTLCDGKLRLDGLRSASGAITVAVIATICGLPGALSCKLRMAETEPTWLGHKLSVILQLFPAASEEVQLPS